MSVQISNPFLFKGATAIVRWSCLVFIAATLFSSRSVASVITGKVTAVLDGNTILVEESKSLSIRIKLVGIDSPELGQEFGNEAKKYLERIALAKDVVAELKGKDRHGNHLAVVRINGKLDAGIELLKAGLAWTSEKNPDGGLEGYRTWAQRKEKGLWKQTNPVPPWTYRRQQSMAEAKGR
jgi:endonuclease YncB( thermonuclease family)